MILRQFHRSLYMSELKKQTSFSQMAAKTTVKESQVKPIVIILPWLGANEKATEKYAQLYRSLGFNVIKRDSKMTDFLLPKKGFENSKNFLTQLEHNTQPIVVHSMSIGCYFYSLMLLAMENEPEKYANIAKNIQFQVCDSPVVGTIKEMAFGVSSMVTNNSALRALMKMVTLGYFFLSKPFTVKYYDTVLELIKYRCPAVPSLLMTSKNDPMACPEAFQSFVKAWEDRGCKVATKIWEKSEHARHLHNHPNEYRALITDLLKDGFKIESKL
uniref:uncharacterized protein LOC100186401 n=1 Tax=Ciona intestinalis TaxID=7719 RepID=UPI000180BE6F|nr:uncharacterized protein LOC100186401 [Ciona intestinalis]|eukprot:XP_026690647.1 uncharacterized protein LOC100186401 [Ciona intestinalis]